MTPEEGDDLLETLATDGAFLLRRRLRAETVDEFTLCLMLSQPPTDGYAPPRPPSSTPAAGGAPPLPGASSLPAARPNLITEKATMLLQRERQFTSYRAAPDNKVIGVALDSARVTYPTIECFLLNHLIVSRDSERVGGRRGARI